MAGTSLSPHQAPSVPTLGRTLRWSQPAELPSVPHVRNPAVVELIPSAQALVQLPRPFVGDTPICTFACPAHSQPDRNETPVPRPNLEPRMPHPSRVRAQEPVLSPQLLNHPKSPVTLPERGLVV